MLVAKRRDLHDGEWKLLFEKMKVSITSNPEEYLGAELPDHLLLRDILDEIFFEFVKEINYHEATSEHLFSYSSSCIGIFLFLYKSTQLIFAAV